MLRGTAPRCASQRLRVVLNALPLLQPGGRALERACAARGQCVCACGAAAEPLQRPPAQRGHCNHCAEQIQFEVKFPLK